MPDLPPEAMTVIEFADNEASGYRLPSGIVKRAGEFRVVPRYFDCSQTAEREIVVCRRTGRSPLIRDLPLPPPPPLPTAADNLSEALRFKIGPVEAGSVPVGDGTYALGLRIRF